MTRRGRDALGLTSDAASFVTHRASRWLGGCAALMLAAVAVSACNDDGPTVISPRESPSSVAVAPIDFDALYVVNGGDASLSVINTEKNTVASTIVLQNVQYPHHVYLSADTERMLVAVPGIDLSGGHSGHGGSVGGPEGAVLVLDAHTGKTIMARRTPAVNHNAIYSPGGAEIWTAQLDGTVLVLDAESLDTTRTLKVGLNPSEVTFSLDGHYAFVADTGSNQITVFDPETKSLTKTIQVGTTPVGAWQGTNSRAYVDNEDDGTVSAIDVSTLDVVLTYRLGFTPGMIAFGPDGNVWVADSFNAKVVIFRPDRDERVATVPAGDGAHGIAFRGDGKFAYVTNQVANTLSVIDVESRSLVQTLPIGQKPNGLVWRAASRR